VHCAPAAGLLTGRSGSSPPRAAGRPQRRPGHVSPPPPPSPARRGWWARSCQGAAGQRIWSARSGREQGWGQGEGFGEGTLLADGRHRETRAGARAPDYPGRGPESQPPPAGDPCREGQEGEQPGAPWRLRGTPVWACSRVARVFPGLGARWLSSSHTVTAGDVSASRRAEGTRGGAGFWASRELCPLSCHKKPNQKANLQASKANVTLSAGRESRTE
jgi:hypothetical protein